MIKKGKGGFFMEKIKAYILENKMRSVKIAVIVVLVIAAGFVFFLRTGEQEKIPLTSRTTATEDGAAETREEKSDAASSDAAVNESGVVVVDIGGQVVAPQVLELPARSRISDAIEAAGGLTKKADLTSINRAQILTDGEKIYIPAKGENPASYSGTGGSSGVSSAGSSAGAGASSAAGTGRININTADSTQLQEITGVGPATAEKIIAYRQKTPFKKIEDLMNVSGIGEKTFQKMKEQVTI